MKTPTLVFLYALACAFLLAVAEESKSAELRLVIATSIAVSSIVLAVSVLLGLGDDKPNDPK